MSEFVLEVQDRPAASQNSVLTDLRAEDRVPGVIYGYGREPLSISAAYNPLFNVLKGAGLSNIVTLNLGGKEIKVIVKEYQKDPISDRIVHVDFLALNDKRKVSTDVPLEFVGVSSAVREQGGKLNIKNEKVRIQCLPADLPAKISIDLSQLTELGQKVRIADLPVGAGVTILNNPNDPVLDVNLPKKMAAIETTTASTEGEAAKEGEAAPAEGEAAKEGEAAPAGQEKK
ncbi:MAG: 50S ribosomal protein L25 [Patescibacteria group bacterium]|nr:50S ribosomal protein L25 [Patescibacteria group bacterium]